MKWPDLSAYQLKLMIAVLPSQQRLLVLAGADQYPEASNRLGFRRLEASGQWVRDNLKFTLSDFRREFPRLNIAEMEASEIIRQARIRQTSNSDALPPEVALMQARYLGRNLLNEEVWEGADGRYRRTPEGVMREGAAANSNKAHARNPAAWLRAPDMAALLGCADGFVNEMMTGKILRAPDVERFAAAVYGEPIAQNDIRLRQVQEAIEAAVVFRLANDHAEPDRAAFEQGLRLYESQPLFKFRTSTSVALQQFSTPLPMAAVAQRLLGRADELRGQTVQEPTIGNGALVSLLPESRIVGFDLDQNRLIRTIHLLSTANEEGRRGQFDLQVGDASRDALPQADYSIVNPPFGGLPRPTVMNGLRINRLDHLVLMRSLESRAPDGRTVAIIAGDSPWRTEPGHVVAGSRHLFNWLADHYHVDGVVECDGGMYSRVGSAYPVRMLVIGPRRGVPLEGRGPELIPDQIEVVRDYEQLWDWSEKMLSARAIEQTVAAPVEDSGIALAEPAAASEPSAPRAADAEENSWQAPYVPLSQVGEPSAMIPRNLVAPTRKALAAVVEAHGDIDAWVASELGWSIDELGERLSPEQVDASALAFHAADLSRGMILADQTGLGKGRVIAAFVLRAARRDQPVIFATEKANLFSDLYRDLQAIGAEKQFTPMILNAGVPIRDTVTGKILVSATPAAELNTALDEGDFIPGTNIAFCTYSQFNRAGRKRDWLSTVSGTGVTIILDESHVAAGESNTGAAFGEAVSKANDALYSSATFAKNAQNLAAYAKAFPPGMELSDLPDTIAAGGEALQEVLSSMLAEDGVLVRREHDLSTVEFEVVLDAERFERNRAYCDALSPILSTMAYLGGDIKHAVAEINRDNKALLDRMPEKDREGARLHVSSMEFGSRLYSINRLFILALETDLAIERSLSALRAGEKPVIFVENTMESLLRDIVAESRPEFLGEEGVEQEIPEDLDIKLEFRDLLQRTLDRMMIVSERNGYGVVNKRHITDPVSIAAYERCASMIENFPDLPVSPKDLIRDRVEKDGYGVVEISGRQLQVVDGKVGKRPKEDRNKTISRFNSGQADGIMISLAGSTGLSLHAGAKFPDQRRRALIELQIANNVSQRVQVWGRVNRKDQVVTPRIVTLNTGLPAQARLMAMQNTKLRKLSANVTSNRSSAAEDDSVPDILNWVGDVVCRRMLENRPDLAARLMIDLPSAEEKNEPAGDDLYFVNKLLGRLTLLPSAKQEELYQEIATEFRAVMEDFEARGVNPFRSRELDGSWQVAGRSLFEGSEGVKTSVFNEPIYATTLIGERLIKPIRSDQIEHLCANGRESLSNATRQPPDAAFWDIARRVEQMRPGILEGALSKEFESVEAALAAGKTNSVQQRNAILTRLVETLDNLRIAGGIQVTDEEGETRRGAVLKVDVPPADKVHQPGLYAVTFVLPGDERPRRMSLYALMKDPVFSAAPLGAELKAFDEAPEGKVASTRMLLDGNLFRATQYAQTVKAPDGRKLGAPVVWHDQDGVAHRGILLPRSMVSVAALPVEMRANQTAAFLREIGDGRVYTKPSLDDSGVVMRVQGNKIVLSISGTSSSSGIYTSKKITEVTGDWAGDRERMSVAVPMMRGEELMQVLADEGFHFYTTGAHRTWANEWAEMSGDDAIQQHQMKRGRR